MQASELARPLAILFFPDSHFCSPIDGSSISSAANKHLELTSGVSCAIDEPSSSRGATGFSMLTGSSSCTIGMYACCSRCCLNV
jgi:hypothetical protein